MWCICHCINCGRFHWNCLFFSEIVFVSMLGWNVPWLSPYEQHAPFRSVFKTWQLHASWQFMVLLACKEVRVANGDGRGAAAARHHQCAQAAYCCRSCHFRAKLPFSRLINTFPFLISYDEKKPWSICELVNINAKPNHFWALHRQMFTSFAGAWSPGNLLQGMVSPTHDHVLNKYFLFTLFNNLNVRKEAVWKHLYLTLHLGGFSLGGILFQGTLSLNSKIREYVNIVFCIF